MAAWTEKQQKKLGWYYFIVALVTLVIAVIIEPVGDWEGWTLLLGAALAILGIVGLYQGITGKGNTRSSTMTESRQRVFAIVGLVAISVAAVISVISTDLSDWTASDMITVGIWVALGGLFVSQIATLSKSE